MAECAKFTYHKNPNGGGGHIEFPKMSISPNWMKIFPPKFGSQMHHGHGGDRR